jgi:3-oxo-5alpha-steroid 4-dehydrogenase
MIVDRAGEIVGVEVLRIPRGFAAWRHARLYGLANNTVMSVLGLLGKVQSAVVKIEGRAARPVRIRVKKGVVLAAGGFAYNRTMLARTAPEYLASMPLGTIGDDGSGIKLGMTAGARTDLLHKVSAWKFIYAPATWTKACSVGPDGERLVNEEFYGARTGEAVFEKGGGKGWLILDQRLQDALLAEVRTMEKMFFQKIQLNATLKDYTVSAATLDELAQKIGVPADRLAATVAAYNRIADGAPDPMNKAKALCPKIEAGPFYATDMGASLKLAPIPALTMGGLVVDEDTGQVIGADGAPVKGLFAAGRTAIGICSHYYVSGLSLGDCVWSGWRAAETLKGNGGAKVLAPEVPEAPVAA